MIHHISSFCSLCLSFTHTHRHTNSLHMPIFWGLFLSFISSSHLTCLFHKSFFSLPSYSTSSVCLATFEACHSSCFVEPYSLISTSAFVTLVRYHSQVLAVGRLGFGNSKLAVNWLWRCPTPTEPKLWPWSAVKFYFNEILPQDSPPDLSLLSIPLFTSSIFF